MDKYKDIIKLETISSTNKYALDLLKTNEVTEFTTISTNNQWDGRGQMSNSWESEPFKNLTLSIILCPNHIVAHDQFVISQAVSIGIVDFLQDHKIDARIKWPNDIYVGNKKICGILIENILYGAKIKYSVIGVGLNVNQEVFLSDAPNPTSIVIESGKKLDIETELSHLQESIIERYLKTKLPDLTAIHKEYLGKLYRIGEMHSYRNSNGEVFDGIIRNVAQGGLLEIESNSTIKTFAFKEVEFIL